jgi:hypothetical protein
VCRGNTFADVDCRAVSFLDLVAGKPLSENSTFSELWFTSVAGG